MAGGIFEHIVIPSLGHAVTSGPGREWQGEGVDTFWFQATRIHSTDNCMVLGSTGWICSGGKGCWQSSVVPPRPAARQQGVRLESAVCTLGCRDQLCNGRGWEQTHK